MKAGTVLEYLERELPSETWNICKLDDVDRHTLANLWHQLAAAYEPAQFHVPQNGLALLVAYILHLIDDLHSTIPQ